MLEGLGLTNAFELAGGAGIVLAGVGPWLAPPRDPFARAFALLAFAVGSTGILASLAESGHAVAPLAGALMPYYVFGTLGAGLWLAAVGLRSPPLVRRAAGAGALLLVIVVSLIYAASHGLWRDVAGLGPLYLALGGRYLLHGALALVFVQAWRRRPASGAWALALGFLLYATHETVRWWARATLFPWGATTIWADASFVLRLAAVVPLALALWAAWSRARGLWLLLLPVATTLLMRATVSEGVFSSSDLEVAEVELWRTTAYALAGFGVWRGTRLRPPD